MEFTDEEVALLYRLFRSIQMMDRCPADFIGCQGDDGDFVKLQRKIKEHINEQGAEWMFGKKIPYWW